MKPTKAHIDALMSEGDEVIAISGVRADESPARAKLKEYGDPFESYFGIVEWRPLLKWKIEDVFLIHARYGIPRNPLYDLGAKRVGCFPCIMSSKPEIRTLVKHFPERIDFLREQEWDDTNGLHTFFPRKKVPVAFRSEPYIDKRTGEIVYVATIDDVVAWSKTKDKKQSRGQMALDFWHDDETAEADAQVCPSTMGACE